MFATVLSIVLFAGGDDSSDFGAWFLDYGRAIKAVEEQDKPLFIVFDKVDSDLGRMVASDEFVSSEVERTLGADYIRMFVDVETEAGLKLAEQFGAAEFPRIVVIDRSTNWQAYRRSGSHSPSDLLSVLTRYRRTKITSSVGSTTISSSYFGGSTSSVSTTTFCRT
jgi:hypothetical protein